MLDERSRIYLGWFAATLTFLWITVSRRLFAWIGATLISAYLAVWGGAFSGGRRAANLINDLSKRSVFITGCDSGFGNKLALRVRSMGVSVYAGVLSEKSEGAETLRAQGCKIIQLDITQDLDVKKALDYVTKDLGDKKLHAVVNNAGVCDFGQVEWCGMDVFNRMLQVNTLGTIRVTQAFLPLLRKQRGSRVVIVASVAGRFTSPGFAPYSVSKHAVISFADGLRKELKPWKISVHTIQPTAYDTPLATAETVSKCLQANWNKANVEVKKSYGENYFQTFKANFLRVSRKMTRKNLSEVVDEMLDAILSKEPKINYIPSLSTKFRVHMLTMVPSAVQDFLMNKLVIPDMPPSGLAERVVMDESQSEVFV